MTVEPLRFSRCTDTAMFAAQPVLVFLGAPGSGKGTQSTWLAAQLRLSCLSTGDILRTEAKRNTPEGFRLRRILASGSLVSDEMVCQVVKNRLRQETRGIILDGFPRTVRQAVFLDGLLSDHDRARPTVIHLDISAPGLLARLNARRQCARCGSIYNLISNPSARGQRCERDGGALVARDDDRESVILKRLKDFEEMAEPLLDYYAGADLHTLDAERELASVSADLLRIATGELAAA